MLFTCVRGGFGVGVLGSGVGVSHGSYDLSFSLIITHLFVVLLLVCAYIWLPYGILARTCVGFGLT